MYAAYILEYGTPTKTGKKYYVGQTQNVAKRVWNHWRGQGATATKKLGVKRIVAVHYFATHGEAFKEEERCRDRLHAGWEPSEMPCSFIEVRHLQGLLKL